MKLAINLKLDLAPEQAALLRRTVETANRAANWASGEAIRTGKFKRNALHKVVYRRIRERFGLSAQMAVRTISKVADAYTSGGKKRRSFRSLGAIAYDDRILSFKRGDRVSIWTMEGRKIYRFLCGDYQRALLPFREGEADLLLLDGQFYLCCVRELEELPPGVPAEILGVDFGIVNIAADSDGEIHSGSAVEQVRRRYLKLRRALQKAGTKNAKRHLVKLKRKEANFRRNENHRISKTLVRKAKDSGRGIGLEDLTRIRGRLTVRRCDRARFSSWAFAQPRDYVEYKARRAGVWVETVDPRNSSRECFRCGFASRKNRLDQSTFCCRRCGHRDHADRDAARVISLRAIRQLASDAVRAEAEPVHATGTASPAL